MYPLNKEKLTDWLSKINIYANWVSVIKKFIRCRPKLTYIWINYHLDFNTHIICGSEWSLSYWMMFGTRKIYIFFYYWLYALVPLCDKCAERSNNGICNFSSLIWSLTQSIIPRFHIVYIMEQLIRWNWVN